MEFLKKEPNIDFLGLKTICIGISLAIILGGFVSMFVKGGLRKGIDFTGGTQLILAFREPITADGLRTHLQSLVTEGEIVIQHFEDPQRNEFLIRLQQVKEGEDVTGDLLSALSTQLEPNAASGKFDLNRRGAHDLAAALESAGADASGVGSDETATHYQTIAETVIAQRNHSGIFHTLDEAINIEGVPVGVREWLRANGSVGPFSMLSAENVGPQVGEELRKQALMAIGLSVLGILAYVALRFELRFGIGAVVALIHDVLVTLAFFSFFDKEITLVVVAALLTLVGYSVNDTVVIYDRIRENRQAMGGASLPEVINKSMNQMLARTIVLSAVTMFTVLALFFFGGEVIHDFAFALVVGIVAGAYSTIYIASPVVLWWDKLMKKA